MKYHVKVHDTWVHVLTSLQIRLIQRAGPGAGVNMQQKEIRLAQISLGIVAGEIKLNTPRSQVDS